MCRAIWRGVGAADRAGFENQCALMGTGGSNPPLSGFFMSFHEYGEAGRGYYSALFIRFDGKQIAANSMSINRLHEYQLLLIALKLFYWFCC